MENFLVLIAEILEVDEVRSTDILEDFDSWDSLTVLSIIALIDDKFKKVFDAKTITSCITIQDLYDRIIASD